jgi:hypothetical protein
MPPKKASAPGAAAL